MKERPKTGAFLLIAIAFLCIYLVQTRLLILGPALRAASTRAEKDFKPASAGAGLVFGEPIDVNIATAEDLKLLPGIGPKLSRRIIEERAENGRYISIDALRRVKGLTPGRLKRVAPYITTGG